MEVSRVPLATDPDGDRLVEEIDHARAQFVDGADHLQFTRLGELREDRIEALEPLDALRDVGLDDVLELVAGLALAPRRTAGRIGSMRSPIDPGKASLASMCSMAALTAPHWLWPSTMMSLTPSSATANSMLPFTVGPAPLTMFPATRTTNRSPTPWSKTSSGATRESAQPTMMASGRLPLGQRREVFRLPPGVDELTAHEPLVALEQPREHGSRDRGPRPADLRPARSTARPARPRRLPAR